MAAVSTWRCAQNASAGRRPAAGGASDQGQEATLGNRKGGGSAPTVLLIGPYRFFFYSDEGGEPPHIHVTSSGNSAKLWLDPVELARSFGYTMAQINEVWRIVVEHRDLLEEKWHEYHGSAADP